MASRTLAAKLFIGPDQRLLIINAPDTYVAALDPLPDGATLDTRASAVDSPAAGFDAAHVFVRTPEDVAREAPAALAALLPGGLLWMTFPKGKAKADATLTRDHGWEALWERGWRPVTLIAVDETWSAMRYRPVVEVPTTSSHRGLWSTNESSAPEPM